MTANIVHIKAESSEDNVDMQDEYLKEWTDEPLDSKAGFETVKHEVMLCKQEVKDEHNTHAHVKAKVIVVNTKSSSGNVPSKKFRGELHVATEKLCQDAVVSEKVASLCRYICTVCFKEIRCWVSMRNHFSKEHDNKKLSVKDLPKLINEVVCHVCKVCSDKVLCDTALIIAHLRIRHNVTISQYKEQFGIDNSKILPEITYSEYEIGDLCEYRCDVCGRKFNVQSRITQHQKVSHGRKSRSKDNMTKRVIHKCKICKMSIACMNSTLKYHFKQTHGKTLKEYCKITGCIMAGRVHNDSLNTFELFRSLETSSTMGNLCLFACNLCNMKFNCSKHIKEHNRENHPNIPNALRSFLVSGFSYKCKKCFKLMLCDEAVINRHVKQQHFPRKSNDKTPVSFEKRKLQYEKFCSTFLKDVPVTPTVGQSLTTHISNFPLKNVTSIIGNLCQFRCPRCDFDNIPRWNSLKRHCKIVHKSSLNYNPTLVTEARYHACLLCQTATLSDRSILASHVRNKHGMTLAEYERIFRKHGGRTLLTYSEWLTNKCY